MMNNAEIDTPDVGAKIEKRREREYVVFATNPAICYAAYLDTYESVVCAGFQTSDLKALMNFLCEGVDAEIQKVFPRDANIWFPLTVIEISLSNPLSIRSVLRHLQRAYNPPRVTSVIYRDEYASVARTECDRLFSLKWSDDPAIFTIDFDNIKSHPLYEHLRDHTEVDYYNENVIVKQIIDRQCEKFFDENSIAFDKHL